MKTVGDTSGARIRRGAGT